MRPLLVSQLNSVEVVSHVLLLLIALLMATDAPPYSDGLQICFFLLVVPPLALYGLFVLRARRQASAAAVKFGSSAVQTSLDGDSCVHVGADEFDPPLQHNPSLALASSPAAFSPSASAASSVQPEHIEMHEMRAMRSPTHGQAHGRVSTEESPVDGIDRPTPHQAIV